MAVMHDEGKGGFFIAIGLAVVAVAKVVGDVITAAPEHRKAGCAEELNDEVYLPAAKRAKRDDDRNEVEREKREKQARKDRKNRKNAARGRNP